MYASSSDSLPSWIEAIGAAFAVVLSVISMAVSLRTEKKAKTSQRLSRLEKQLQTPVDRIETIDKTYLSSPGDDNKKLSLIVAKKTQEYAALFSVYRHALPHDVEEKLNVDLTSMQSLEDAALLAAKAHAANLNDARSAYVNAMANFVVSLKNVSIERLAQVSEELEKLS